MTREPAASLSLALARSRADAGLPVDPSVIAATATHAEAIGLAVALGAPLAPVLAVVAEHDRAEQALRAEVRRASAEGRTVAVGLVVGPPVMGVLTAGLVTDDPMAVIVSPAGRGLVALAVVLWLLGAAAVVGLVRHAGRPPPRSDATFVLVATAVRAGEPLPTALRRAAAPGGGPVSGPAAQPGRPRPPAATPGRGRRAPMVGDPAALALWLELGGVRPPPAGWTAVGPLLADAVESGVALAPVLDEIARDARRHVHAAALERAARLGARLSVPTSLLLLPAGLLFAAGPVLLAALGDLA